MDVQIATVRKSIPMYVEVQKRLYDYLINKTIPSLKITNDEYLSGVDFVYNNCSGIQVRERATNKDKESSNEKYQEIFFEIYLEDMTGFAGSLRTQLKQLGAAEPQFYINAVNDQIKSFKIFMFKMVKTFFHLNSSYLKNKHKDIHVEGATIFKTHYIEMIYPFLLQKIFATLSKFKEGHNINNSVLHDVIYSIAICGFPPLRESLAIDKKGVFAECHFKPNGWSPYETVYFKQKFTSALVQRVEKEYSQKCIELIKLSSPEYARQAQRILSLEQKIASLFYDNDSAKKVVICAVVNILANQYGKIVMDNQKTGVQNMLQCKQFTELNQLHSLIKQSDLISYLSQIFQRYIGKEGTLIVDKITPEEEKQLKKEKVAEVITKLLELKDFSDYIVSKSFNNDVKLQQGRDTAFHTLINRSPRVTNFLCYYADTELRKDRNDDNETQKIICGILKLFRYIYSTDAFFKTYQKLLCIRVLSDNLKNRDMEIDLISELKAEAGAGALSKITTMVNDITNSEKFNAEHIDNNEIFSKVFKFKLMILTTGSWPIYNPKTGKSNVPEELLDPVNKLDKLYEKKFPGKVLNWIFSHGSAVLEVKFKMSTFLLTVGGFQLIVLLMFKNTNVTEICVSDVSKKVKTEEINNLYASILQLVKLKILIKDDDDEGKIETSNTLRFNPQFSHKNRRVNCVPMQKNVQKSGPQITQQILRQRQILVESIIVKVMKTRKVMKYDECTTETTKLCKMFKAELSFVKRRIEALIEKEYLKRDDKDTGLLIYTP